MTIGENMKVKWAMDFVVKLRKAELISADQGETARLLLERMRGVEVVACDQNGSLLLGPIRIFSDGEWMMHRS